MSKKLSEEKVILIRGAIIAVFCWLIHTSLYANDTFGNVLMPGLSGGVLVSTSDGSILAGGGFHFSLLYGRAEEKDPNTELVYPACWEFFVEVNLYRGVSRGNSGNWLFDYLAGASISFDRANTLSRNFFIPYYGIKAGGVYLNTDASEYNGLAISPFLGISIIRTQNFFLNVEASIFMTTVLFRETLSFTPALLSGITF
jgi:hypothetical protein